MPRTTITSLFGTSPVKPLQQHMEAVIRCVQELTPFIEAVLQHDWDQARERQARISRLEQEADTLKRDLLSNLPRSLFMPGAPARSCPSSSSMCSWPSFPEP